MPTFSAEYLGIGILSQLQGRRIEGPQRNTRVAERASNKGEWKAGRILCDAGEKGGLARWAECLDQFQSCNGEPQLQMAAVQGPHSSNA